MSAQLWRNLTASLAAIALNVLVIVALMSSTYTPSDIGLPRVVQVLLCFSERKVRWIPSVVIDIRRYGVTPRSQVVPHRFEIEPDSTSPSTIVGIGRLLMDCDTDRLYRLTTRRRRAAKVPLRGAIAGVSPQWCFLHPLGARREFVSGVAGTRRHDAGEARDSSPRESFFCDAECPCHFFVERCAAALAGYRSLSSA
jgi:hypothetical protein